MISSNDLFNGVTVEVDGQVYTVTWFQHVKPGKGSAFVNTRLKNVKTGSVIERTFRAGEKLVRAVLDKKEMQYLYSEGDEYHFMDTETYEQIMLPREQLGDTIKWLKPESNVIVLFYEGKILGVEPPTFVELQVVETAPGVKGDTAAGGGKPATLETGAVVTVPFFVNVDDIVRIDTRTGVYLERV